MIVLLLSIRRPFYPNIVARYYVDTIHGELVIQELVVKQSGHDIVTDVDNVQETQDLDQQHTSFKGKLMVFMRGFFSNEIINKYKNCMFKEKSIKFFFQL